MKTIKDTDPKKTKKKSSTTGTTYPATKETPSAGESLVLKKGQSVETWGGAMPSSSAPKPVKKTTAPGTTYPATRGQAPAAVPYPKKKGESTGVVHYKEGGKMVKTIKKKPTHSVMPQTPEEEKAFKDMMWQKKNEISPSAPVGGEAQRTKYEERWMQIKDKFEFGGKLRKKGRAFKYGGKMKK
jgi:hypothetical protein